ncbi:MAG: patatin-like phospholipase family protein [Candidatus Krumholzibacteriota bacterium]
MKIGLVLGGGGARGFAHVGVLKSLEKRGIEPVAIAGCSMGGIVGALIAAGIDSGGILEIVEKLKPWKLLDVGRMGSLIGGRGMAHQMEEYLPATFEELNIPLAVTAVDLQEGKLVVLSEGPLPPALRGTSSIPGIISTEQHDGRYLIDGGLLNNLPVDVIRSLTNRPVVAVDVASPPDRHIPMDHNLLDQARDIIKGNKRPLTFELFMKAFDIPAAMLTDSRLALNPPEILVKPRLDPDLKTEDLKRYAEAIDAGFVAAEAALDQAEKDLESRK